MALMRVVQMPIHEIIDMAAVRHSLVAAAGSVNVPGFVPPARVAGRAGIRVLRGYVQSALVHMIAVHRVQAAVVKVVDVISVADGGVAAPLAVDVHMLGMNPVLRHSQSYVISETPKKG